MTKKVEIELEEGAAEANKATIEMKGKPDSISDIQNTPEEITKSILDAARSTKKMPKNPADKEEMKESNLTDSFKSLCEESGLDETLLTKATALFEAAFAEKVKAFETELVEDFTAYKAEVEKTLKEEHEASLAKLEENIKVYSDHVAEKYLEENKLSIENGIKLELAESLMNGMQKLFVEHNIAIPEKIDALKALEEKVTEVTNKLNDQINENINLKETIKLHEAKAVIDGVCSELTATQADKVRNLAESLTYSNLDELKTKLQTVCESVVVSNSIVKKPTEDFLAENAPETKEPIISESMKKYLESANRIFG